MHESLDTRAIASEFVRLGWIFRYRSLSPGVDRDRVRASLSTGQHWFSPPSKFNDPFECTPRFTFSGTKEQIREFWSASPTVAQLGEQDREAGIQRMIALSENPDRWPELERPLHGIAEQQGFLCLNKSPVSIPSWSHYADGHKGICLVLAIEDRGWADVEVAPFKVRYSNDFPIANVYELGWDRTVHTLLAVKSLEWEYEQEWRFLSTRGPGLVLIPDSALVGIILGCRTSPEDERDVRTWVGASSPRYLRAVKAPYEYRLDIVPA